MGEIEELIFYNQSPIICALSFGHNLSINNSQELQTQKIFRREFFRGTSGI